MTPAPLTIERITDLIESLQLFLDEAELPELENMRDILRVLRNYRGLLEVLA